METVIFNVKKIDVDTDGRAEVYLREYDAKRLNVHVGDRVELNWDGSNMVAVVNVCSKMVELGELGVSKEIFDEGITDKVRLRSLSKPVSVGYIRKRLLGIPLKKEEIRSIVFDLMKNKLSSVEAAYFVASAYVQRLSFEEEAALSEAIVDAGKVISFPDSLSPILDKHCIGGVPGNRTTPITVPIVAAAGFTVPKTSSRAITSPAGTADVMEVLAKIVYPADELKSMVKKNGAAMIWGGSVNLAPVDDLLLKLRYPLRLDPTSFLLASIVAKKKAAGSEEVLIDIPLGAKVASPTEARELGKRFKYLGKRLGMEVRVAITDGFQPIGRGVGPSLEARDVLEVLQGKGPEDLREKSLRLAAEMLQMGGLSDPYKKAKDLLDSGKAYETFQKIIESQEGDPNIKPEDIEVGEHILEVKAPHKLNYTYYDSEKIAQIARLAGAPAIKGSGLEILLPPSSRAKSGETLMIIRTPVEKRLDNIREFLKENSPLVSREVLVEII